MRSPPTGRVAIVVTVIVALAGASCAGPASHLSGVATATSTSSSAPPAAAGQPSTTQPSTTQPSTTQPSTTRPSTTSGAGAQAPPAPAGVPVPDPALTPGVAFPGVTAAQVCTLGYATSVRNVPQSEKQRVYVEYHVVDVPGDDEVDHLISLELGGSNDIGNLWPEPYAGSYGAHAKDKVENYLHEQVCAGKMSLLAAQSGIATAWWVYLGAVGTG
jgi:hypothetical protein